LRHCDTARVGRNFFCHRSLGNQTPDSGIYQAGDSNGFARTVAKLYAVEIIEQPNRIYLRAAAAH
jgi:hypothetical protein